jgi:glutathione S-transferase
MELAGLEPATSWVTIQAAAQRFRRQKVAICSTFAYRFEADAWRQRLESGRRRGQRRPSSSTSRSRTTTRRHAGARLQGHPPRAQGATAPAAHGVGPLAQAQSHVPGAKARRRLCRRLDAHHRDAQAEYPEPPLYPHDDGERRRALELEEHFDAQLGPYIRRWLFHEELFSLPSGDFIEGALGSAPRAVKTTMRVTAPVGRGLLRLRYGINDEAAHVARDKTAAALDRIEAELQPSGYLVGDRFSVADLTAAALLFRLVRPPEAGPYLVPPPLPPAVERFRAEASGRRAFEWVREMYRRHRGRSAEIPG